ncbi:hypothetical protein [Kitasatospora sp. NPDC004289]
MRAVIAQDSLGCEPAEAAGGTGGRRSAAEADKSGDVRHMPSPDGSFLGPASAPMWFRPTRGDASATAWQAFRGGPTVP